MMCLKMFKSCLVLILVSSAKNWQYIVQANII